jgi:hypothetical protein
MAYVFEKLNLKDRQEAVVLQAPASFEPELARLPAMTIHRQLDGAAVPARGIHQGTVTRKRLNRLREKGERRANSPISILRG